MNKYEKVRAWAEQVVTEFEDEELDGRFKALPEVYENYRLVIQALDELEKAIKDRDAFRKVSAELKESLVQVSTVLKQLTERLRNGS